MKSLMLFFCFLIFKSCTTKDEIHFLNLQKDKLVFEDTTSTICVKFQDCTDCDDVYRYNGSLNIPIKLKDSLSNFISKFKVKNYLFNDRYLKLISNEDAQISNGNNLNLIMNVLYGDSSNYIQKVNNEYKLYGRIVGIDISSNFKFVFKVDKYEQIK